MSISVIFIICFLIGALPVAYFHERKNIYYDNKEFSKPDYTLVADDYKGQISFKAVANG